MAATSYSLIQSVQGSSWAAAYGAQGSALDIMQIVDAGGSTLLNITSTGVVHNPASGATKGTSVGVYETSVSSGTTAQIVAAAFTNPQQYDILQLIAPAGGGVNNYIDYLGVSH